MKFLTAFLVAVVVGPLTVMGLQCYRCVSNKSKEDCASHAVKTTCPSDLANAVCAEGDILIESGAISSHIFLKACADPMKQPTICNQEGVKCNIEYCDGDLCNGADDGEGEEEGGSAEIFSCNQCLSDTSIDDCIKNQKEAVCPAGIDRCAMLEYHSPSSGTTIAKGCIPEDSCRRQCEGLLPPGSSSSDVHCKLSCCETSMCN
ncbi:unnamed protein product [Porites lobata]|uniref:UPAR/Ly6 domain-containing protein n=1 Tax=Porites lobata TaxID=104759 RepID=A0ABN8PFU6_9CNID|nr:unnamed protein product [Porites lobata]